VIPFPEAWDGLEGPRSLCSQFARVLLPLWAETFTCGMLAVVQLLQTLLVVGSQNHRIVWVGRDLARSSSPTPLQRAGTSSTDHVTQSPIQPGWMDEVMDEEQT